MADGGDDVDQPVRAQMRMRLIGDLLRRTGFDQFRDDFPDAVILDAGGQLAVGKCAGSALPILDVAFRIQRTAGKIVLHIALPFLRHRTPLQDQRLQARFRQQ